MDDRVTAVLAAGGGAAAVAQLLAVGVSRDAVDRLVRAGHLLRPRRGVVLDAVAWAELAPWERHGPRARAAVRALAADPVPVLTHHSALAVHGIGVWGVDDRVHVARADGSRGSSDRLVRCHRAIPKDLVVVDGHRTAAPALACLQVAAAFGTEAGLVSADRALHDGVVCAKDLSGALELAGFGRWTSAPAAVVALADGRSESAAETRARWLVHAGGLPSPIPQVVVRDEDGGFVARVDLYFEEEQTVFEVDGMAKYASPADLRAEKLREDRVRTLGHEFVRAVWADLDRPEEVRARLWRAFARSWQRRRAS